MFFPFMFPCNFPKSHQASAVVDAAVFFPLSFYIVYPRSSGVPDRYLCKDQVRKQPWVNAVEIGNL